VTASVTWIPILVGVLLVCCLLCVAMACSCYKKAREDGDPSRLRKGAVNPAYAIPTDAAMVSTSELRKSIQEAQNYAVAAAAPRNKADKGALTNPTYTVSAEPTHGTIGVTNPTYAADGTPSTQQDDSVAASAKGYIDVGDALHEVAIEQHLPPRPVPAAPTARVGGLANMTYQDYDPEADVDDLPPPPLPTKQTVAVTDEGYPPPLPVKLSLAIEDEDAPPLPAKSGAAPPLPAKISDSSFEDVGLRRDTMV